MKRQSILVLAMSALLFCIACTASGRTIFVDANTPDNNDGSSWAKAYKYLQDALLNANAGDEIWVAQGTYRPDESTANPGGTGSRTATFQLKNGVAIYGGFAGTETSLNERDWQTNKTILSGDLNGDDVGFTNNGENSYHVVTGSGTNETALLDGFTITSGNANNSSENIDRAGGMYIRNGSPTVANCTFIGNSAYRWGGGMCCYDVGRARIINCTFVENQASWGGGICTFRSNKTGLMNCMFSGNLASSDGGGMYNRSFSFPTLTNCVFVGNSAGSGGGMYNRYGAKAKLTNCTFVENQASWGGGIGTESTSNLFLINCLLWYNTAGTGSQLAFGLRSNLYISYSDLQWGVSDIYLENGSINWGQGNIDTDPLLALDGYHLLADSPCINAGDPAGNYTGQTDIDGQPRSIGDRVDIGADEFINHIPIAHAGSDQTVYAWFDGMAKVILDGTGSYDDDGHPLTYNWTWNVDGNSYDANGVNPIIELPVDEHLIELIVSDGIDDSEPDEIVITVMPAIETAVKLTPKVLNTDSHGNWIKAHFTLPEGYSVYDVDVNTPATIEPLGIESEYMNVFVNEDDLVEIEIAFDRAAFCGSGIDYGPAEIVIVGMFTSGQYFYGTDTVRIIANNLKYLAVFASYWIETGCGKPDWCGGVDLDQNTVVDFVDFALFDGCCIEVVKD